MGIDHQGRQRHAVLCGGKPACGIDEADPVDVDVLTPGRLPHDQAYQVVCSREDAAFFAHAIHRLACEDIKAHCRFHMGQVRCNAPSGEVEFQQGLNAVEFCMNERRDQGDGLHPKALALDLVPQFSHRQVIGQLGKLRLVHPGWPVERFEPCHELIARPERCAPAGPRLPLLSFAVCLHGTDMRTPRGQVDNKLLVHTKDDVHAALDQQGDMGIGTEPPVRYQQVARWQGRMEGNHLGYIMGTQGSREDCQHHAGTGMTQRHQLGDGQAATGLLASWLANMGVQFGGIRHRNTGTIDPKGAMAEPVSLIERLVWSAVATRSQPPLKHTQRKLHAGLARRRCRHGPLGQVA
jgi:hypothetical protein